MTTVSTTIIIAGDMRQFIQYPISLILHRFFIGYWIKNRSRMSIRLPSLKNKG